MVLPFPLLFSVAAGGYLDYSCSVHGGRGGAPCRGSPGSCFWRRTHPTREMINSQGPAKGLWLCLLEQAGLDRLVARGWVARENKAPSAVPAQAELASGWSCSKAPAAPRAPRLSCDGCSRQGWEYLLHLSVLGRRPIKPPLQPPSGSRREPPPISGRSWRWPWAPGLCTPPSECPLTYRSPVAH